MHVYSTLVKLTSKNSIARCTVLILPENKVINQLEHVQYNAFVSVLKINF